MAMGTEEQPAAATKPATAAEPKPATAAEPKPATAKPATTKPAAKAADNVVFVGKKPTMSYVLAVITQFNSGINEVKIKARGRSISRAVDVAEVVNNKFIKDLKKDIATETEQITDENKNIINVSTISISLKK